MAEMDFMAMFGQLMQAMQQYQRQNSQRPMWGGQPQGQGQRGYFPPQRGNAYADRAGEQQRLRQSADAAMGRTPQAAPRRPMYMDPGYGGWSKPYAGGWQTPQGERPMYGGSFDPLAEQERLRGMREAGPLPPPPPPSGQDWVNPSAFANWQAPPQGSSGWSVTDTRGESGGFTPSDDPWASKEYTNW